MKRLTIAAALLFTAVTSTSVFAQTPAEHELHHPAQSPTAPTQPTTPPGQSGMGSMPMPMMNMMGNNMGMMRMMEMSGPVMGTIDRVEGRIAFLCTELKITDAQTGVWNTFADALRTNAQKLGAVRASMTDHGPAQQHPPTLSDRLDLQERWLLARLEGTRAIKSAFTNLYAALSDDQKKTANEILAPHMGMMPMTSGQMGHMQRPGSMQPGQMQPGQMLR